MRIWPRTVERCLRQCQRAPLTALWKPCGIVTEILTRPFPTCVRPCVTLARIRL